MKTRLLLVALAASLSVGCASKDVLTGQVEELKALDAYHDAQRKQDRAIKSVAVSTAALQLATLEKLAADKEVAKTKEHLESLLSK